MTKTRHNSGVLIFGLLLVVISMTVVQLRTNSSARAADKLTPKDVISKHLEAVGAQETRDSIKTRMLSGEGTFSQKSGRGGQLQGPALMASDGKKILLGVNFGHTTYPFEQFGYDSKKLTVAFIAPATRSALGNFLITEDISFREGLMGGVLSSAWPLFDEKLNDSRIQYGGLKKFAGQQVHELRYYPRKGSESQIKLLFDAATFNHVRTEYLKVVSAQAGSNPDLSSQQRETRYDLWEDFGDFKKESGLMLPHSYKVQLTVAGMGPTYSAEWAFTFSRFQFNQNIPAESFNVEKAPAQEKK